MSGRDSRLAGTSTTHLFCAAEGDPSYCWRCGAPELTPGHMKAASEKPGLSPTVRGYALIGIVGALAFFPGIRLLEAFLAAVSP